jgi:hypothetical protein
MIYVNVHLCRLYNTVLELTICRIQEEYTSNQAQRAKEYRSTLKTTNREGEIQFVDLKGRMEIKQLN